MNTKKQTSNGRPATGATLRLVFGRVRTLCFSLAILAMLGMTATVRADRVNHDVSAGYLLITQPIPGLYDNTNTTAGILTSVNGLSVVTNVVNMGDYRVQIGSSFTDDTNNGVLMVSAAQNGRLNWTNGAGVFTNNFQTPCAIPYGGGFWEAGIFRCPPIASATANQGEDNVDVTVAYFPFSTWLGGYGLNFANGTELTNFIASPSLVRGVHFIEGLTNSAVSSAISSGVYYVDLRSLGIDSRRDGVLIVNEAKNEANFAMSRVNNDDDEMDGTWTVYSHDNRANGRSYEPDPVAFVFVPKTNTAVVSGMFMGDGAIAMYSGNAPAFTVTWRTDLGNGQYELKIPGRSPADGVLITSHAGGDPFNGDNIVTFQKNGAGDGWIIQSRDLPACGLQSPPEEEPVCSFVFVPAEKPGVTVTPNKNLNTTESGGTAQFTVTVNGYPKPTANVTVNLSSTDVGEGTVSTPSLTFTPAEWNVPKLVTITGVDDAIVDGTQPYTITLSATTSADPNFNNLATTNVGVLNIDNEASVAVSKDSITTTESGGTDTFSVWLTTAPTDNVTVPISSSDLTEGTVSTASLTFTPGDYATPQVVTVTGVDDLVQDGNIAYTIVTGPATSTDVAYNNFDALDVAGVNLENDTAGVVVPASKLTISEPNTSAMFALVLASQPTANVTINCVSTDTTEGTVTPSVTFTPGNWNVPQNVTVTAVDDLVNDGPIDFSITTTVSSSDPVYAAINPADVAVVTLDNEGDLELPSGALTYGSGDAATGIEGYATVSDTDTADYDTGSLTVTITAGGHADDRLDVRNDGTGPGQIGVAGSVVSYGGVNIGTKSGGTGLTPLAVTFNSASTPAAAQALARAITYRNVNAFVAPQNRMVSFALADGDGGVSTKTKMIIIRLMRLYSYQQEADGGFGSYLGALDTQIDNRYPNDAFPAGDSPSGLWIDFDPLSLLPQEQMQCFLKFTNIFGAGVGQIPLGSKIVFAEIIVNVADSGHGARFNRMLGDWDESVTFNSLADGISLDDIEAVSGTNTFLGDEAVSTTTGGGLKTISATSDLQAWSDGAANYGWVMSTWQGGANGTAFSPCEATNILLRPRLRVGWVPAAIAVASFQEGAAGYTGQVDTQVRLVSPTTSYAGSITLSPDWLTSATPIPNQNQALVRFDNIIGSGVGQVPAGATIYAATLEFTGISAAAQGAGAQFYPLRKAWTPTDTWTTWVNGIDTDNIDAASVPTTTLPVDGLGTVVQATKVNVEITADVQAWVNGSFANNGWALMPWPNGNNGWAFNSADEARVETRPKLRVFYTPGVVITSLVRSPTTVTVKFTGEVGKPYSVLRSATAGSGYGSIGTATVAIDGTGTFVDNSPLATAAFYRIVFP